MKKQNTLAKTHGLEPQMFIENLPQDMPLLVNAPCAVACVGPVELQPDVAV